MECEFSGLKPGSAPIAEKSEALKPIQPRGHPNHNCTVVTTTHVHCTTIVAFSTDFLENRNVLL